ncbi:hypothetical protein FOZ61_002681, partial [Perkinsus olseni]
DSQGRVSKVAPENIQEELAELCQSGFSALQPSPDSPLVDGFYTGTRMERNVSLEVHDGKIMGAGLTVKRVGEDCRSITYYPVCDGMLAIIVPAEKLPTEDKAYYVMLKKSEKPKKRSESFLSRLRRKRSDEGNSDDVELQSLQAGNQGSHPLCNAAHERRKLNRDELLEKWDRNMPEDFVLKLVLLVHLTDAQGYRQQEVLYGRVHGVGTEFFFVPGDEAAIGDLDTAYVLGISGGYDEFRGQTSSRREGSKTTRSWTSHL